MKISIVIPTHKMKNGEKFLKHSLNVLKYQTFQDFEIVVTDNSDDNTIKDICHSYELPIRYFRNTRIGMAQNTNEGINNAEGELIKILFMDDYLFGTDALSEIVKNFKPTHQWLVSGCVHTVNGEDYFNPHFPVYNKDIFKGENTIGSPSVLTIRKQGAMLFDENMTWLLDCDLYKRYYDKYGEPKYLNSLNVIIRQGDHQMTNIINDSIKLKEYNYLLTKNS